MRRRSSWRSTPHLAAWAKMQIDGALAAAGTCGQRRRPRASSANVGVLYHGLEILGGGAILTGLVLGAIAVFVIERQFVQAAAFALAGAVLTYFGFMHGEAVGIGANGLGVTPAVAFAYLLVAGFLMGCARYATVEPLARAEPSEDPELMQAAPAE